MHLCRNFCKKFHLKSIFNTMQAEAQTIEDEEQWEELLSFRPNIFRLSMRLLQNEDKAHDATQDILVKLKDKFHQHDPHFPLEYWVMRCTTNYCLSLLRREKIRQTISLPAEPLEDKQIGGIEDRVLWEQVAESLQQCMGERNFWIYQQTLLDIPYEEISRLLPKEFGTLSFEGMRSVRKRNIKPCVEKARQWYEKSLKE